ncbi:hypothetical protein QV13_08035 [Mesorhizobium hungaricum]|uniref:Uncharacterized protein n=1 Tax=Mesorhizobium hungaricum TaxID=1566387 RepID=A0A1C2E143_9HYPH|nr:hypothetical protein QV13_08035 [Mesorhizobium hungaricum]
MRTNLMTERSPFAKLGAVHQAGGWDTFFLIPEIRTSDMASNNVVRCRKVQVSENWSRVSEHILKSVIKRQTENFPFSFAQNVWSKVSNGEPPVA